MNSTLSSPPWTCPFCALLCDRFGVDAGETLKPTGTTCPRATRALAQFGGAPSQATSLVNGQPAAADAALDAAARWLRESRQPLFGGMATDVAGTRSLYRLANACGAIIDHAHGRALMHGLTALQDRGAFTTTLAEIRTRADLIVCIGSTTPSSRHPEFFARCGIGESASLQREIVFVGSEIDPALTGTASDGVSTHAIPLQGDLYDTIAALNASLTARPPRDTHPELAGLVRRMLDARYTAIVWTPADLPGEHATLLVEGIDRLLKTLNRTTRAGGLALGGGDGGATVNQVLTWLSGLPLRTRVRPDGLEHEPLCFDAARLLADDAVDSLLWVSSFDADLPPPADRLAAHRARPSRAGRRLYGRPGRTVFIPVSTPGIGSAGHCSAPTAAWCCRWPRCMRDTLPMLSRALAAQRLRQPSRGGAA